METGSFPTLRAEDAPRLLEAFIRYLPYVVTLSAALIAYAIALEATRPRGTLLWLAQGGASLHLLSLLAALCALTGALGWRRARRHALASSLLCVVIMLPFVAYCVLGGAYLSTLDNASIVVFIVYLFGSIFGLCLLAVIILLAAWLEISRLGKRMRR